MIDFKNVTIPVLINSFLQQHGSLGLRFEEQLSLMTICQFSVTSRIVHIIHPAIASYFNAISSYPDGFIKDALQLGNQTALDNLKLQAQQITSKHPEISMAFLEDIDAEKALSKNINICILQSALHSTKYLIPADISRLARAFTISAHTGALVSIDVDKQSLTADITTLLPHSNNAPMKPMKGLR